MKKYIAICEKSSIMENLAEALPEKLVKRGRNYYGEHYQIHALSGHIFELFNMEDYPEYPSKKKGWDLDALPFFPKTFRYKLMQKTTGGTSAKKIFDDIVKGIEWADAVIHVGDSDDEGQVLVDNVLHYAKCTKPVYRLIQDSNTVDEFKEALQKMKPNNSPEYKAMALEGRFRAFYDWLYGINASRYASLKFGTTGKDCFHVGRVITAIVFEIFKRDYEIQNFVPQPYFQNVSKEGLTLTSKTTFKTEEEASKVADQYNRAGAKVIAMNRRKTVIQAPKLFSQNTLQGWMGKYYKMSPSDTLKTVQSLYENGYASYPRTESEYLKSEEKNKEICEEMLEYLSEILNINLLDNELLRTSLEGFIPASIVRTAYGIEVKNPFLSDIREMYSGIFATCFTLGKFYEEYSKSIPSRMARSSHC